MVAMWFDPHFMKKLASLSFSAVLSSTTFSWSGLRDEMLFSYVEVVSPSLATYDADEVLAPAVKYLESYKQDLGILSTEFAESLYTGALRCVLVYEKNRV